MSTHEDDQGAGAGRYGQQPPHEGYEQPYGGQPYGGQPYGGPPQSGRPGQESGGSPYGQQYPPAAYGQQSPGAPGWDQQQGQYPQPYGQQYGQGYEQYGQQHGQTTPYGYGGYPQAPTGKPGGVVTAAVLGFVFGAFGVIVTIVAFFAGALATGASGGADDLPGLGAISGAIGGAIFVFAVLALLWTVLMIWGSVWALTGRSRVLLLVGGSIAILFTGLSFISNLSNSADSTAGSIIASLLFFAAAIAIVVLLSVRRATQWFAAVRAARGR